SVLGGLATTWLLYERVLPFSGALGFFVSWYLVFLAFYAGLTAVNRPRAVVVDRVMTSLVIAAPSVVGLALASTVVVTLSHGLPALLHANFYTHDMSGVRPSDQYTTGGALAALVGTLIEVSIAVAIALPLGVITAVYMSEVGGRGARLVRTIIESMTALPSIVAGLFIYSVFIAHFHMPRCGFAAALALAVMGLPIMARASDVVLRVVPGGLREASYALGAGRFQTVWRVVLPTARPGLATALILGIARMVGETSPLLLTSGASSFLNWNPLRNPMNSLPLYIFDAVKSGEPRNEVRGYAAAVVLLVIVLALFLLARLVARGRNRG
ncbi:MAG: phosphate transporter permease PtsA, partial [Marmoricola sp.]|nr:phosphate transporter permease PtsA [Marmoricola sp.]